MRCTLHTLFQKGMITPRHRYCLLPRLTGDLSIVEARDPVRRRQTRLARLTGADGNDIALPLHDAQVVTIGCDHMVVSGIERHEDLLRPTIEYAQSWWVQFRSGPPRD